MTIQQVVSNRCRIILLTITPNFDLHIRVNNVSHRSNSDCVTDWIILDDSC